MALHQHFGYPGPPWSVPCAWDPCLCRKTDAHPHRASALRLQASISISVGSWRPVEGPGLYTDTEAHQWEKCPQHPSHVPPIRGGKARLSTVALLGRKRPRGSPRKTMGSLAPSPTLGKEAPSQEGGRRDRERAPGLQRHSGDTDCPEPLRSTVPNRLTQQPEVQRWPG